MTEDCFVANLLLSPSAVTELIKNGVIDKNCFIIKEGEFRSSVSRFFETGEARWVQDSKYVH